MNRKTAYLGLLAAVAIIFGYVETLLPVFIGIPGVKLGLANLVTVLALYMFSWREAGVISLVRICVIGFMFGNLFSIAYSLSGAALSLLAMALMKTFPAYSMAGVSITGAVAHNMGQLLVAMIIVENFSLLYYLPVLLVSGLVTGLLIGLVSRQVYIRISPIMKLRETGQRDRSIK